MIHFLITEDYAELSRRAAELVAEIVAAKPDAAIVVATGDTPMGLYGELAKLRREGRFDPSRLRVFQLDAYLGVAPDDPRSLYGWMGRSFLAPLGVQPEQVVRLPGDTSDVEAACRAYDEAVAMAGGFDLAILGLGPNGHLGFNEPPSPPDAPTRPVDLTEASLVSNAAYWGGRDRVPLRALTAGMVHLLGARRVLLLVAGEHKRDILRRAVEGPLTPDVPASYLRLSSHVTVLTDRAAAL